MRLALLSVLVPCLAQAAAPWPRLYSAEAAASSFLRNTWNTYQENHHPSYALDDDPKTAWVEGAEGDGVGESLTIPVSPLATARGVRLVLFNGYQKSPELLAANAAPRLLTVTVRDEGGFESAREQLTLERKMGPQSFDIPVTGGVADVVLTIDSVYPGSQYRDTCVSDVQVFVDSDVKYNAQVEQGKRKALLAWKKARLADAKYFASLPANYPYASTHFEETSEEHDVVRRYVLPAGAAREGEALPVVGDASLQQNKDFMPLLDSVRAGSLPASVSAEDTALLQELEALVRTKTSTQRTWYALSIRGRILLPENFSVEPFMREALHLPFGALFEAKGPGALVLKEHVAQYQQEARSNVLLLEGSASAPKKVYFTFKTLISDRATVVDTTHVLALFEAGRLTRMVSQGVQTTDFGYEGNQTRVSLVTPTYVQGKLSRLEIRSVWEEEGLEGATPAESVGIFQSKKTLTAETRS